MRFINIDRDFYSSTVDVLSGLTDRIVDGTIIVFDEFFGYRGFDRHEAKAFFEFARENDWDHEVVAVAPFANQLAVRLRSRPRP